MRREMQKFVATCVPSHLMRLNSYHVHDALTNNHHEPQGAGKNGNSMPLQGATCLHRRFSPHPEQLPTKYNGGFPFSPHHAG
jgi:hypothetical protein